MSLHIVAQNPVQRIPDEILIYIFTHACHDEHDLSRASSFPVTLSHVSSRWRRVALSAGRLWTTIILTYPSSSAQKELAVASLVRSKHYPLTLYLDFRDPDWDWSDPAHTYEEYTHPFRWQDMINVLRLLLPHVRRWRKLKLLTDTWAPMYTFLAVTGGVQEASMLEELSLFRCNAYFVTKGQQFEPANLKPPLTLFSENARLGSLRRVTLVGVHTDWEKSGAFRGLQTLKLKYHPSEVMPDLRQFKQILASCPDLNKLVICGWGPRFIESTDKDTDIIVPKLTTLRLGYVDRDYASQLVSHLHCPQLEKLTLKDVGRSLPPLEPLDSSHTLEALASTSYLSTVRDLKLHGIEATENSFTRLLDGLKSLERITVMNADGHEIFASLSPLTTCPRLVEVRTKNSPCPADIAKKFLDRKVLLVEDGDDGDVDTEAEQDSDEESGGPDGTP